MNVVILMLAVTACYTICSLNDKYAAAKANLSGDEFTFLMCSSMSVFLAISLPFQSQLDVAIFFSNITGCSVQNA